jgi:hypothetical protein
MLSVFQPAVSSLVVAGNGYNNGYSSAPELDSCLNGGSLPTEPSSELYFTYKPSVKPTGNSSSVVAHEYDAGFT